MSGFKKVLVTTLIIASVSIGIGAYIILESGLGTGDIADNFRRLFSGNDININIGNSTEVKEDQSFNMADKKLILLETPLGDVEVKGYEGEEIRLTVEGQVPERYVDEYLKISESQDELKILFYDDVNNINFTFGNANNLDIELLIPSDYAGELRLSNVSGAMTLEGLQAREVHLENISGDLVLEDGRHEKVVFSTISGQFISYSAVDVLEGETVSGRVTATDVEESFEIGSISGSVSISARKLGGDSSVETVSGSVEVELTEETDIGYDLSSVSGRISVENEEGTNESSQSLKRTAQNGFTLDVSSVSGKITVKY